MDSTDSTKQDAKTATRKLAQWWTDKTESSWAAVKKEAVADWDKAVGAEKKLADKAAEEALAFGHGARDAYQKLAVWGGELEDKLKADWKDGHRTEHAWDKVKDAVKHGWQRAQTAVGSIPKPQ